MRRAIKDLEYTGRCTTTGKSLSDDELQALKWDLLDEITALCREDDILPELVFNFDQTHTLFWADSGNTHEEKGEKCVGNSAREANPGVATLVIGGSAAGHKLSL